MYIYIIPEDGQRNLNFRSDLSGGVTHKADPTKLNSTLKCKIRFPTWTNSTVPVEFVEGKLVAVSISLLPTDRVEYKTLIIVSLTSSSINYAFSRKSA